MLVLSAQLSSVETLKALDERFSLKQFALLLIALIVIAFPAVVIGTQTFFHRDFGLYGYPMAHYHRECFWRGELPLWNPYSNCGLPFLAQWGPLVLYPLSLIYLLLPMPWGLNVFCLVHLFLAGTGMYVLAFQWTGNRFAASVAGLVFAFNGFAQHCLMWPNYIAGLSWMPWLTYWIMAALRDGGHKIFVAGFIGSLQMLTGTPELTLCTWLLVFVLALSEFICVRPWGFVALRRFASVVLIVAGIAAAQLVPFLDLLAHSQRHQGSATGQWALPLWGWANFVVPLFRCTQFSSVAFQQDQALISSYYAGIATVALTLVAIWRTPKRRTIVLAVAGLASLLLAFGEAGYFYGWLRGSVPQIGFMRFPVKFVITITFIAPLLAAEGIRLLSKSAGDGEKTFRVLVRSAVPLLFLMAGIVWFSHAFPVEDEVWSRTFISGLTRGLLLIAIVAAFLGLVRAVQAKMQMLVQCAILFLIWLDLRTHVPPQNPTLDPEVFASELPAIDQLAPKPALGHSRAVLSMEAMERFSRPGITNLFQALVGFRLGLSPNFNLLHQIPMLDGYYSLYLKEEREVHYRFFGADDRPRPGLAAFLNVSQVSASGNILQWEAHTNYLPLITGGQRPIFADRESTLAGLMSSDFVPQEMVFLPPEAESFVSVSNRSQVQCLKQTVSAHRMELDVQADGPALVVISQAFYRHWVAYVDGKQTRLWRANHAFQALRVTGGRHRIQLVYKDRGFLLGGLISGVTLLASGAGWFWMRKRNYPEGALHVA